jgi:hypothetical protein
MTALKGGTHTDFSNSMADAIEQEFKKEWLEANGEALPDNADRSLLFAAIATGILNYLKANQDGIINTITLDSGGGAIDSTVTHLDLNIQS